MALVERDRELAAIETVVTDGGVLLIEGGAGIGKTSLLDAACDRARGRRCDVLTACGSELEADFAFGIVRQLFERRLADASARERSELLSGGAGPAGRVLLSQVVEPPAIDASFAVLHGLYWLTANLADQRPLVVVIDDLHWADGPSLRWLAHLAPRVEGLALTVLVGMRPRATAAEDRPMLALRDHAVTVHPALLSDSAAAAIVRSALGGEEDDGVCAALATASGGNPFYLQELVRTARRRPPDQEGFGAAELIAAGGQGIARRLAARVRALHPDALALAQSFAVLGDRCGLRPAAAIAGVDVTTAARLADGLVGLEVLSAADPPQFLHPIVRDAIESSLGGSARDAAHRAAAELLFVEGAPPGQVATHLVRCRPADDPWIVARLREAAGAATAAGAPHAAAELLRRALAEPPPSTERVEVLRELARAEVGAGRETACRWLEDALALTTDPRRRAQISVEIAESYAALFRWGDAVDVIERALDELGDADRPLAARLHAELVVSGLHDARCSRRVAPALAALDGRALTGFPAEARGVAAGMAMVLRGAPAHESGAVLEMALAGASPNVENWDVRAALLWSLVTVERFDTVRAALEPLLEQVRQSGSTRGLVAGYSTLGLLQFKLGALPEADAAARVALAVLQGGDFGPGVAFGATVLAEVAIEAGLLDEATALLDLVPTAGVPAGVGSVLVPAALGRLRLAQGRAEEALRSFETCGAMFTADLWGMEVRDVGYLHARAGAALALWHLGERDGALALADAELADVRQFGGRRALGVATRVAGLVRGGERGRKLLTESVDALRDSPALLERAKSLAELGSARRRAGQRLEARPPLVEALDLAARCGARPLSTRVREELALAGARPRRDWREGFEALTPSERRVVRLAVEGRTNRQIAAALYVSIKTVEGHLAHAYTKLGISGRSGLARALDPKVEGGHPVAPSPSEG